MAVFRAKPHALVFAAERWYKSHICCARCVACQGDYIVVVDGFDGQRGRYNLTVSCPSVTAWGLDGLPLQCNVPRTGNTAVGASSHVGMLVLVVGGTWCGRVLGRCGTVLVVKRVCLGARWWARWANCQHAPPPALRIPICRHHTRLTSLHSPRIVSLLMRGWLLLTRRRPTTTSCLRQRRAASTPSTRAAAATIHSCTSTAPDPTPHSGPLWHHVRELCPPDDAIEPMMPNRSHW